MDKLLCWLGYIFIRIFYKYNFLTIFNSADFMILQLYLIFPILPSAFLSWLLEAEADSGGLRGSGSLKISLE